MSSYEQLGAPSLSDIPLPQPAVSTVHRDILRLVNGAMQSAYPQAGIRSLRQNDVRVVTDAANLEFHEKLADRSRHSYEGFREITITGSDGGSIDAMTMHYIGGRPIFISERYLLEFRRLPQSLSSYVVADLLIHERIHQLAGQKAIPLTPDSPLFQTVAFSDEIHEAQLSPLDQVRNQVRLDELVNFTMERSPMLLVDGGLVELFCMDNDGKRRKGLTNGYDLNEGLAEYLAVTPREALKKEIRRALRPQEARILTDAFEEGSRRSVMRVEYPLEEIEDLMGTIGLTDRLKTLQALRAGTIPEKWAQVHTDRLYP